MCGVLSGLTAHHRHKLHLAELQPHSCRGQDIKRLVALQALSRLVRKTVVEEKELSEVVKTSEADDKGITDVVKVFQH